jgi:hypothetical protein
LGLIVRILESFKKVDFVNVRVILVRASSLTEWRAVGFLCSCWPFQIYLFFVKIEMCHTVHLGCFCVAPIETYGETMQCTEPDSENRVFLYTFDTQLFQNTL